MARPNNKSSLKKDFKNVKKLANYNGLNYTLLRETTEMFISKFIICNDIMQETIDNSQ